MAVTVLDSDCCQLKNFKVAPKSDHSVVDIALNNSIYPGPQFTKR